MTFPEDRKHPKDLLTLLESFKKGLKEENFPCKDTVIITYSENLILWFLKQVRINALKKEDICIKLYCPDGEGRKWQIQPLNDVGELTEDWPEGFFEERIDLLWGD